MVGLGLGLIASPTLIAAQSTVDWQRRGVVTGANVFARSMGSAVGVAVCGAIANASLPVQVGGTGTVNATTIPVPELTTAIQHVFIAAAVVAVLLVGAIMVMPSRSEHQDADQPS